MTPQILLLPAGCRTRIVLVGARFVRSRRVRSAAFAHFYGLLPAERDRQTVMCKGSVAQIELNFERLTRRSELTFSYDRNAYATKRSVQLRRRFRPPG